MNPCRTTLALMTGALLLTVATFSVQAQERTASSSVDAQVTWTALTNLVQGSVAKSEMVNARVDQVVICNRKAMLYAPGGGADSDGCIENSKIIALGSRIDVVNTQITTINDQINTLNGRVGAAEGRLNKIDGTLSLQANQIRDLYNQTTELFNRSTDLYNKVNDLFNNVNTLHSLINNINSTLTNHASRITSLENQVANINSRITAITNQIATLNAQIADLYNRSNDLYNRTNDLYNNVNYMKHCGDNRMVLSNGGCVKPSANCLIRTSIRQTGQCGAYDSPVGPNAIVLFNEGVACGSQQDRSGNRVTSAWIECN